jgi:hypothetical protein
MRYFLHQIHTNETVRDPEGSEHGDFESAKNEATDAAREMMSVAVRSGRDITDWSFVIADDQDIVIDRVIFAETIIRTIKTANTIL